jgi:LysM repeat protein
MSLQVKTNHMRWRLVALVSLGVNLLLVVGWIFTAGNRPAKVPPEVLGGPTNTALGNRPNIIVRRQFISWRDIESPDYPTYIANLRDIGCPEQTMRDIIIADVNALFSRRLATELVSADQQWWRSEPDTNVLAAAAEKVRALEDERRVLLTKLLGPTWESGDLVNLPRPSRPGIVLDGPVLGALPTDVKQSIQDISLRSEERLQAYLNEQRAAGEDPDPLELARIREQTRDELKHLLTPPQLEDYLLRYSQTANNLRGDLGALKYFSASPDEFRALFRATDNIDQRLALLADGSDPNTAQARKALLDQRENAIRIALGQKRYDEYVLLHDPLYRAAMAAAQQAGTPEAVRTIYQINLAAAAEQAQLNSDPSLTIDQKNIQLKQLEADQLRANTLATGQELPPEPPPAPPPRRTYTVRQGDNAAVVAMIYGLPVSALRAANPNLDLNRLKPGDAINIPKMAGPPIPPP